MQAGNRVAILHSTVFDASVHSKSFEEKGLCPICWEDFKTKKRVTYFPACEHVFHTNCIKEWVKSPNTRQTCRRAFPSSFEMS